MTAVLEFASLLNNQSKTKIEEGKIYEATVTKISQKYCWVHLDQLKSEPAIDINEIKCKEKFECVFERSISMSMKNLL